MVDKSRNITVSCRINNLTVLCAHHVGTGWILVQLNPFFANIRINIEDISYVLHYKLAFCNKFTSCKAPPFITSLYRIHIAILVLLEAPVFAPISNWTNLRQTVLVHRSIQALFSTVIGLSVVELWSSKTVRYRLTLALKCYIVIRMQHASISLQKPILLYWDKLS
jgi:hypothetical protein